MRLRFQRSLITLLVPFDSANTLYTTEVLAEDLKDEGFVEPAPYRILTMSTGANLTVNGAVSLCAKQRSAQGNKVGGGSPYGPAAVVQMDEGSRINVNNGDALYCHRPD